jgi:hypothetical protein
MEKTNAQEIYDASPRVGDAESNDEEEDEHSSSYRLRQQQRRLVAGGEAQALRSRLRIGGISECLARSVSDIPI